MTCRGTLAVMCMGIYLVVLSDGYTLNRHQEHDLRRLLCLLSEKDCQQERSQQQRTNEPQWDVYLNGKVYTVDGERWHEHPKQAIVIGDGKIKFVGTNANAEEFIDDYSRVYDLHGSTVLPGIHDIHMHPLEAMSPMGGVCLLPNDARPDHASFQAAINECKNVRVGTTWLLGGGYAISAMMDYVLADPVNHSPKRLLDRYVPNRPAAFISETSHSIWVNTLALAEAGYDASTPDSPGTVIMREPGSQEPNGIIFENGAMLINEIAMNPARNHSILKINYDGLLDALYELSENGITSICDARMFWKIQHNKAWESACDDDLLSTRTILGAWAYPADNDDEQIQKLKDMHSTGRPGCSLKTAQIKVYMDGIVQSTTAAMLEQYNLNLSLPVISKDNIGLNYFNQERLELYLKELQSFDNGKGYDFNIHAIGDRGVREALNAIEAAYDPLSEWQPRHRLTHVEIVNKNDIHRFESLGVIADFQLAGHFVLPSETASLAEFIGFDRAAGSIPVKPVLDTGALVTLSSDWDVSPLNPFIGIQHAGERGNGSIAIKSAIEMYTRNAAWAMRQEDEVGRLVPELEADLIIIDKDVLNIPVHEIGSTKVLRTIFKGMPIYSRVNAIIEDVTEYYRK